MPWPTSTCSEPSGRELWIALGMGLVITSGSAGHSPVWWSGDDPVIFQHAITHPVHSFFFNPTVWRDLTFVNLTPLLAVSFRLDWLLFGFSPVAFHLHQWLVLWLALVLLYRITRHWLNPLAACTVLLGLGLSKPFVECAHFLMLRHYVEGLALSLAAVALFLRLNQGDFSRFRATLKILVLLGCCIGAASAKEIFVPLPLLLTVLPVGTLSGRLRTLILPCLWLLIYPIWRRWMLGAWLGGYGTELLAAQLLELPAKLFAAIGLPGWIVVPALLALVAFLLIRRRYRELTFAGAAIALAVLPIVPVAGFLVPRYALVPAVFAAVLLGWCCQRVAAAEFGKVRPPFTADVPTDHPGRRPVQPWLPAILCVMILVVVPFFLSDHRAWRRTLLENLRQQRVEGEFLLRGGGPDDFILDPAGQPQFYDGLNALREKALHLGAGPRAVYDPVVLFERPGVRLLRYDSQAEQLRPIAAETNPAIELQGRLRTDRPLAVTIRYRFPRLEWELGPYPDGQYSFLLGDRSVGAYPVPRRGRQGGFFRRDSELRVKYSAPEGWVVYSPPLKMVVTDDRGELEWQGEGVDPHRSGESATGPIP